MCASKGRRQMSQALLVWVAGVTPAGQEALSSLGLEGVIRAEEQQETPPGSPRHPSWGVAPPEVVAPGLPVLCSPPHPARSGGERPQGCHPAPSSQPSAGARAHLAPRWGHVGPCPRSEDFPCLQELLLDGIQSRG